MYSTITQDMAGSYPGLDWLGESDNGRQWGWSKSDQLIMGYHNNVTT
jgi:hypothetical protein